MNRHENERKLIGPWRTIHGAIWLLGLAVLLSKGWIWPGILVLIVISAVFETVLEETTPKAFENNSPDLPTPTDPAQSGPAPDAVDHRADWLPSICPRCGGPVRGHEVKWSGVQSADCPFCGANLPLTKK